MDDLQSLHKCHKIPLPWNSDILDVGVFLCGIFIFTLSISLISIVFKFLQIWISRLEKVAGEDVDQRDRERGKKTKTLQKTEEMVQERGNILKTVDSMWEEIYF